MKRVIMSGFLLLAASNNILALKMLPADRVARQKVDAEIVENIKKTYSAGELDVMQAYREQDDFLKQWFGVTGQDLIYIRNRALIRPVAFFKAPSSADVTFTQEQREGRMNRQQLWQQWDQQFKVELQKAEAEQRETTERWLKMNEDMRVARALEEQNL